MEVPLDLEVVEMESDSLNLVGEASRLANPLEEDTFLGSSNESDMGDDEGVNCSALKKLGGLFIVSGWLSDCLCVCLSIQNGQINLV